jgi:hypothetical protein
LSGKVVGADIEDGDAGGEAEFVWGPRVETGGGVGGVVPGGILVVARQGQEQVGQGHEELLQQEVGQVVLHGGSRVCGLISLFVGYISL